MTSLSTNLSVIQDAHLHGYQLHYSDTKKGIVVTEHSKYNIFVRFANWVGQKSQSKLAQKIVTDCIRSTDQTVITTVRQEFFVKKEDLFTTTLKKTLAKSPKDSHRILWGEQFSALYEKLTTQKGGYSRREVKAFLDAGLQLTDNERRIASHALGVLNTTAALAKNKLITNFGNSSIPKEPITLFDSKAFIAFRLDVLVHNAHNLTRGQKDELATAYQNLKEYYKTTHLTDEFEDLELEMMRDVIFALDDSELAKSDAFCTQILEKISHKLSSPPSVHGHPRQLINPEDIRFLNRCKKLGYKLELVAPALHEVEKLVGNLQKACQDLDLKTSRKLDAVIQNKKSLLTLELSDIGRKLNLKSLLGAPELFDSSVISTLKVLFTCKDIRGPEVDLALLHALKKEHDSAPQHPSVAIEGGGPTGLLLAMTQYQVGADVTVFEKRSTEFDRTQVVRLDPKWVDMLQFYLGEKFYKLFVDKDHRGVFRSDGFVEIMTKNLEDVLNQRLAELTSIAAPSTLTEYAAHEAKSLQPPERRGEKFTITASYVPSQDRGTSEKAVKTEVKEVDFVFCAGGKSSPLLQTYLPSTYPVNAPEYYGVCSWLTPDFSQFRGQKVDEMSYFQDFRGIVQIDEKFITNFLDAARSKNQLADLYIGNKEIPMSEWTKRPFIQTRTFENKGMIYIGMEMPAAFEQLLSGATRELKRVFQEAWFEQIGKTYKLSSDLIIDSKFLATFPVEQNRLAEKHLFSQVEVEESKVFIAASGDAFASPHFMRYSGLTGARENIVHLQEFMRGLIHHPEAQEMLVHKLEAQSERTAQFVIGRGHAFLSPKTKEQISKGRIKHIRKTLKRAQATWTNADSPLTQDPNTGTYSLQHKGTSYNIIPQDGYITLIGKGVREDYQSIAQLKLKLGI